MRIKHWQGYGTVDAKRLSRTVDEDGIVVMRVKVSGDHEWGLVRDDPYDLKNWLIKRFDKDFKDQRIEYYHDEGVETGVEWCIYTFGYKEDP